MRMQRIGILLALVCLGTMAPVDARNLYVAVDGNDANPGTAERPFATLRKAQEAARAIIKEGLDRDPRVISGGRTITGWKKTGERWTTEIPEVREGKWHFRKLFVNGQRRPRARAPIRFHKAGANTIQNNNLLPIAGQPPFAFNACEETAMTFAENNVVAGGVPWRSDAEKPEFIRKAEDRIDHDIGPRSGR